MPAKLNSAEEIISFDIDQHLHPLPTLVHGRADAGNQSCIHHLPDVGDRTDMREVEATAILAAVDTIKTCPLTQAKNGLI
jgi:hypothetical protein